MPVKKGKGKKKGGKKAAAAPKVVRTFVWISARTRWAPLQQRHSCQRGPALVGGSYALQWKMPELTHYLVLLLCGGIQHRAGAHVLSRRWYACLAGPVLQAGAAGAIRRREVDYTAHEAAQLGFW